MPGLPSNFNSVGKNTLALVTGVRPTQDTAVLVQAALSTLQAIYRPGFNYAKAGVMLLELSPQGLEQAELDWGQGGEWDWNRGEAGQSGYSADSTDNPDRSRERVRVMVAMDTLNARYGRGTVKLASAGTEQESRIRPAGWQMKQERRTPRYTTHWRWSGDEPGAGLIR